jgi:hypothetical protein
VRCSQGSSIAGILAISGDSERVDELQRNERSPGVWLAMSIDSRGGGEVRPEELVASVIFGREPSAHFAMKLKK